MKNQEKEMEIKEKKNNLHLSGGSFLQTNVAVEKFSIVIVAKNAADKIGKLLQSIKGLSDDVIVCDTGSDDATMDIVRSFGFHLYQIPWEGYGISKNKAIGYARHNWILSLDSDEKIDDVLFTQLKSWVAPENPSIVYTMRWKNFLGSQWIKHSHWGANWKKRLFNKHMVRWDDAIAHEDVCSDEKISFVPLNGFLEHFSFKNKEEYARKMAHSAMITAEKYHKLKRQSGFLQLFFSPLFTYLKVLLFNTAFLDGRLGWLIAKTSANYTYLKYARLRTLNQQADIRVHVKEENYSTAMQ